MAEQRDRGPAGGGVPHVRRHIVVTGLVQGVGMRPHLARLAGELGLAGRCSNTSSSVVIDVEGPFDDLATFVTRLSAQAPPLAVIESLEATDLPPTGATEFVIADSEPDAHQRTLVAPDTAPCLDCLAELRDPADRRARHPFITCVNCGPRFTITLDLPYDRPATTMAGFALCPACAAEYADPADRRYHAQPISCHDCGPRLTLRDNHGAALARDSDEVLRRSAGALAGGRILAVKGVGGYHLACDAGNAAAVGALRERKHRPDQPFAIMVADLAVAEAVAQLSPGARALLTGPARPIVLSPRRIVGDPSGVICPTVAPGLDDLGLLLPYTPVHHLLFGEPDCPPALVMTSGNRSGEPLCVADDDALGRLGGIADLFLTHDRPIAVPCEDSVMALDAQDRPTPVRRSRGYAPLPIRLAPAATAAGHPMLVAAGAELKNTFTLVRDGLAFVSAHVGDLGSLEARAAYELAIAQAERFHRADAPTGQAPEVTPARDGQGTVAGAVVADLHPGYLSRAWAVQRARSTGVALYDVQHHHAHLASLAAEHGLLAEPLLGLVFDGTGYGCDATIWGGELLLLRDAGVGFRRLGHLAPLPLPGGDAGVRNPARMAAAALLAAGLDLRPGAPAVDALTPQERALLPRVLRSPSGWVATSSAGRLFDVASAILGVRSRVSYEAQAAIELEALASSWERHTPAGFLYQLSDTLPRMAVVGDAGNLAAPWTGGPSASGEPTVPTPSGPDWPPLRLESGPLIVALDSAVRAGVDRGRLAWGFHSALADGAAELAATAARELGVGVVGLTGGVFQNRLLTRLTREALARRGLGVVTHQAVPPNDGGLSLGQAAIGLARLLRERAASADYG